MAITTSNSIKRKTADSSSHGACPQRDAWTFLQKRPCTTTSSHPDNRRLDPVEVRSPPRPSLNSRGDLEIFFLGLGLSGARTGNRSLRPGRLLLRWLLRCPLRSRQTPGSKESSTAQNSVDGKQTSCGRLTSETIALANHRCYLSRATETRQMRIKAVVASSDQAARSATPRFHNGYRVRRIPRSPASCS